MNENFEIEESETEAQILRRSKSDAYYIESVRAFEKAFGMDKLERLITEIQAKKKVSVFISTSYVYYYFLLDDQARPQIKLVHIPVNGLTVANGSAGRIQDETPDNY